MLRFAQFVEARKKGAEVRERKKRSDAYKKFVSSKLEELGAKDPSDLDDQKYSQFVDSLRDFRRVNESMFDGAVEDFRESALRELKEKASAIGLLVSGVVQAPFDCYASGDVIEPGVFSDGSDVVVTVRADHKDVPLAEVLLNRKGMFGFSFGPLKFKVTPRDTPAKDSWVPLTSQK